MFSFGYFPGVWIIYADVSEHSICSIFIEFSFGYFPGVWIIYADVSEHFICSIFIDGTDRVFRNVGIYNSDAREIPKRKHNIFRTRWKFEIKNTSPLWGGNCKIHMLSFVSEYFPRHFPISHYFATSDNISWDLLTYFHHPWPFTAYNITYIGDERG